MKRTAICVDAGYLFAQGSTALTGTKQRRELLVLDASKVLAELAAIAKSKAPDSPILRIYWYDGSQAFKGPTLEQTQLAHLDNVKVRLGFINSVGQQKGVDSLIVTDLIELARLGAICDAVLLSGDEDVRVGVQIAQNYGVRIHLLGIIPSRGSQSKALLQEADTTTEWDTATVAKFLSVRSIPATATTASTAVPSKAGSGVASVTPAASGGLDKAASEFTKALEDGDIKSLIGYWSTQRGIPPEFDGRLLAKSRAEIGRDLDSDEKRYIRKKFESEVRTRAATLK